MWNKLPLRDVLNKEAISAVYQSKEDLAFYMNALFSSSLKN